MSIFGTECDITGCSRTDSGVHANEFCAVVTFKKSDSLETRIPLEKIPLAFCAHLPDDIAVREASWVDSNFHPRYDVKHKEYLYRIWNRPEKNPFIPDMCFHYPHYIDDKKLERTKAIILSMTKQERDNPSIIDSKRKRRIAAGSGTTVQEVNQLLKQFDQAKMLMKQLKGGKGKFKLPF